MAKSMVRLPFPIKWQITLTETQVWQRYFTMKGAIFQAAGEAVKSIGQDLEDRLKAIPKEGRVVFKPGKMRRVVRAFLGFDKKIYEESLHNADLFFEIKSKLNSCANEEKESLILLNFAQIVKDNNEEFYEKFVKKEIMDDSTLDHLNESGLVRHIMQRTLTLGEAEACKKDIAVVLAEIIKKQAQKEEEIKDLASKIDSLTEMWQKRLRKYKEEIEELKAHKRANRRLSFLQDRQDDILPFRGKTIFNHQAGDKFRVGDTYKRQNNEQISLKRGDKVTILMPQDYKGFALVEKKGWFGRRKRGLFPVTHLCIGALN